MVSVRVDLLKVRRNCRKQLIDLGPEGFDRLGDIGWQRLAKRAYTGYVGKSWPTDWTDAPLE